MPDSTIRVDHHLRALLLAIVDDDRAALVVAKRMLGATYRLSRGLSFANRITLAERLRDAAGLLERERVDAKVEQ